MRKILIAAVAVLAMSGTSLADNYHRHHHRHNNNGALIGGVIGGLIIGGMLAGPRPGYYYEEDPYYRPRECRRYFDGEYWNGYRWVATYRTICR